MFKMINVNELDYTSEELTYFEQEMRKYQLPFIVKAWKKIGVPFMKYSFLPALVLIIVLGIIYGSSGYGRNEWMWTTDKAIGLFYILGFGGFTLISHIFERVSTNKLRKRLGLSRRDFNILVIAFQITGME